MSRQLPLGLLFTLVLLQGCGGGGGAGGGAAGGGGGGGGNPAPAPVVLRSSLNTPGNILVDTSAHQLYWFDFALGTLTTIPTNGSSGLVFPDPSRGAAIFDIHQDTLNVYVSFSDFGAAGANPMVYKVVKPATLGVGGVILADRDHVIWPPADQRLAFGLPLTGITPAGIATSAHAPGVVYFADSWASGVGSLPVNGGSASVVYDRGPGNGFGPLACLASDALGIYWAAYGTNGQYIQYMSYTGTSLGSAGPYSNIFGLVVRPAGGVSSTAGNLFFIEEGTGNLYQIQIVGNLGGTRTLLATQAGSAAGARALAVDGAFVYFVTQGRIAKVPIAATAGAPLATPQILVGAALASSPVSVAVDDANVYWTARGLGTGKGLVYSFPKT